MAELTNNALSNDHDPVELVGRDIVWLMSTAGDYTTNTKMAAALRAISVYATVEVVGTATAAGCMFGVSGCDAHVAAGAGANFTLLAAALTAIDSQTLTVKRIAGIVFAA